MEPSRLLQCLQKRPADRPRGEALSHRLSASASKSFSQVRGTSELADRSC
jgi:hypothetical protein